MLDAVAQIPVAPVMPWDALICTSGAVHDALSGVLAGVEEHLRQRLGIADDVTAVLFFGRLSVHAKASPFQLAQAVEAAAKASGKKFALLWCGWFNDDFQRRAFMDTAKSMAPSVAFHHIDGRDKNTRFSIWSAADVFCSLSDNIQESFGLTVIEAMAAGLPTVVSNWDGYRAAVQHGVNGVMIDSYLPKASLADAGYRYISGTDTYDVYIGAVSQLCFVDLAQTAQWLARLAGDEALRKNSAPPPARPPKPRSTGAWFCRATRKSDASRSSVSARKKPSRPWRGCATIRHELFQVFHQRFWKTNLF